MSLVDMFGKEDRTEVKFSEFFALVKQAAQYETVMNAVNCDVPHRFIREIMTGKKEEKGPRATITVDFDTKEFEKALENTVNQMKEEFDKAMKEELSQAGGKAEPSKEEPAMEPQKATVGKQAKEEPRMESAVNGFTRLGELQKKRKW